MKFFPLKINGAFRIEIDLHKDERGLFGRTYCLNAFSQEGIDLKISQCSTSYNEDAGTLRGLHFQKDPFSEKKLIRCTAGKICDVILDLRPGSATYLNWEAVELSAANRDSVFLPEGVAHGFQTLAPKSEILYLMSVPFDCQHYAGVRWNDPAFGIQWPDCEKRTISAKDAAYPDYLK